MSYSDLDGLSHLQLWRTFLAVHASGSFSAAAHIVGITQPAVSAQLQTLERLTGEQLFVRGARGVTPTATANDIAARIAGPFEGLSRALAGSGDVAPQYPVRLGGAAELLAEVVAPLIAPLIADGVRIHVVPGMPDSLFDSLRSGTLDLVISSERPRGRAFASERLVDEQFVLAGGRLLAAQLGSGLIDDPAAFLRAVEEVPLLAYANDVPVLRRYWRHVFGTRLERQPALTFPDLRALREAAICGAGATVLPRYLIRHALQTGTLVDLFPSADPPTNTLHLLRRPASAGRPHVERVVRVITTMAVEMISDVSSAGGRGG